MHVIIQNINFKSSLNYSFCLCLTISESTHFFHPWPHLFCIYVPISHLSTFAWSGTTGVPLSHHHPNVRVIPDHFHLPSNSFFHVFLSSWSEWVKCPLSQVTDLCLFICQMFLWDRYLRWGTCLRQLVNISQNICWVANMSQVVKHGRKSIE